MPPRWRFPIECVWVSVGGLAVGGAYLLVGAVQGLHVADPLQWATLWTAVAFTFLADLAIGPVVALLDGSGRRAWRGHVLAPAAGIAVIYAIALPTLDLRWALRVDAAASDAVGVAWAAGLNLIARHGTWRWRSAGGHPSWADSATIGAAAALFVFPALSPGAIARWGEPATIEAFLAGATPAGTSDEAVSLALNERGVASTQITGRILPGAERRPYGPGVTRCRYGLIAEYGFGFPVSVQAYYYFDRDSKLVDITVTKSIDSP
jgi:hypothetical protein